jgi:uncharacterized membrane protein
MTLFPLLDATHPIPAHAFLAIIALLLGVVQLFGKKGTIGHRILGYFWCGAMLMVAITSFFIHELRLWGVFSPIHILSILTIVTIILAVYYARIRNIKRHKRMMAMLFWLSLVLTGAFTFFPGRIMYNVIMG